jgi:hypothetical protein
MTTATIQTKVKIYNNDMIQLERVVKQWEEEFKLKDISALASTCYEMFNELQMVFTKLKNSDERKNYDLQCYKNTYKFLTFIENKADVDLYVLLTNKSEPFAKLISHYSKYCSMIESKYSIELDSEKKLNKHK